LLWLFNLVPIPSDSPAQKGVDGLYNYIITQVSPTAVLKTAFCTGVCFGGLLGILLGIAEGDTIGLFGGLFLGFAGGLGFGLTGLACAVIFNALVPRIGGIAVTLQSAATGEQSQSAREQSEQGAEPL
jgi:hypothetical protein